MQKKAGYIIGIILVILVVGFLLTKQAGSPDDNKTYPNEKIAQLEDQVKSDKDNTDLLFELALEYDKLDGQEPRAEELYQELIEKKPGENLYRLNLGNLYFDMGRFAESAEQYNAAITFNKKEMNAYTPLLEIYEFSDAKEAVKLDELIAKLVEVEQDPKSLATTKEKAIAITVLARAYSLAEQYEKAIEYYEKKIEEKLGQEELNQAEIDAIKEKLNN